jgi:hypothetical protein
MTIDARPEIELLDYKAAPYHEEQRTGPRRRSVFTMRCTDKAVSDLIPNI